MRIETSWAFLKWRFADYCSILYHHLAQKKCLVVNVSKALPYRDLFFRPEKSRVPYSPVAYNRCATSVTVINSSMFSIPMGRIFGVTMRKRWMEEYDSSKTTLWLKFISVRNEISWIHFKWRSSYSCSIPYQHLVEKKCTVVNMEHSSAGKRVAW